MSPYAVLESPTVPAVSFVSSTVGLWAAIVDQIAPRDPAGSESTGPSWPGRPVAVGVGMFDLAPTPSI